MPTPFLHQPTSLGLACALWSLAPVALGQDCQAPSGVADYGSGTAGAQGVPELFVAGFPVIGGKLGLGVRDGAPSSPATILFSLSEGALPLPQFGATLLLGAPFFELPVVLDAEGGLDAGLGLDPVPASVCGTSIYFQAAIFDLAAQGFGAFTAGTRLDFGAPEPPPLFDNPVYPTGEAVDSLAVADLDGDGLQDVVATAANAGALSVWLGQGSGRFSETATIPIASGLDTVAVGDLNGDGVFDLVCNDGNTLAVLLGQGDGSFSAPATVAFAFLQNAVRLADLDQDGNLDVVGGAGDSRIVMRFGVGDGTFGPLVEIPVADASNEVAVGDVDGDGDLDLAVVGNSDRVLLGDGTGAFGPPQMIGAAFTSFAVELGDLNGDGIDDVVSTDLGTNVVVHLGLGAGAFGPTQTYPVPFNFCWNLTLGDLDDDGHLDVVVNYLSEREWTILRGVGDGTLAPAESLGEFGFRNGTAIADVTQDGRTDFVVDNGDGFAVVLGLADGALAGPITTPAADFGGGDRLLIDLDGDGFEDLVYRGFDSSVNVQLSLGDGSFGAVQAIGPIAPQLRAFALGFVDGDADHDLVVATDGNTFVHLGNGDGSFGAATTVVNNTSSSSRDVVLTDLNNDSALDIVLAQSAPLFQMGTSGLVHLGNGDGTFGTGVAFTNGTNVISKVVAADLDQDGRVDLLVDSFGNDDEILILPGNGDGTFSVPVAYDVASFNVDFGLLDFDMDGNLDLLFTRNVGLLEETAMLPGQAGQFFNAASEIVLGSGVANLELLRAGDVNGDGLLDLTGFDSVLLGASASSLDPPLAFLDTGFAFSDQNGDGALDLVELSSSDDAIAVSLNRQ